MIKQKIRTSAIFAGAIIVSGCSSMASDSPRTVTNVDSTSAVELQTAQRRVSELESQLASREQRIEDIESRIASSDAAALTASDASLFPPNPKPGQCFARVLIPATYQTISEQVLTRDASERVEVIPARYAVKDESILVKEASTRLEVVPAVYGEVQERVLVKPASRKIVEIPAEYRTVKEQVIDKPAHTIWKKGPAAIQTSSVLSQTTTDTGEIMCLVEVPATYRTVERRVLVSPARTEEVEIPAEYKTVTRTVVKQPATTREITVPAEYGTVSVTTLVEPAKVNRISIPAAYETVNRSAKLSDEKMEWRQVMCEVNMTKQNVMALQKALADEGYYKAGIDGIIGRQTLDAARAFAIANQLPAGTNYVPVEVVKKLSLSL